MPIEKIKENPVYIFGKDILIPVSMLGSLIWGIITFTTVFNNLKYEQQETKAQVQLLRGDLERSILNINESIKANDDKNRIVFENWTLKLQVAMPGIVVPKVERN